MFGAIENYSPRKRRLIKRFVYEQYKFTDEVPVIESVEILSRDATGIGVKLTNGKMLYYKE